MTGKMITAVSCFFFLPSGLLLWPFAVYYVCQQACSLPFLLSLLPCPFRELLLKRTRMSSPRVKRIQVNSKRLNWRCGSSLGCPRWRNWSITIPAAIGRGACPGRVGCTSLSITSVSTPSCWAKRVSYKPASWFSAISHDLFDAIDLLCEFFLSWQFFSV